MQMDIVVFAGIVIDITIIISAICKVIKFSYMILNKMELYEQQMRTMNIHILKLALFDENLPITDRVNAGIN